MANYCSCGCGRKVRFAKKRLSGRAGDADKLIANLRAWPLEFAQVPEEKQEIEELIAAGEQFRDYWWSIVHGTTPAPSTTEGVVIGNEFATWEDLSTAVVMRHMAGMDDFVKRSLGQ